MSARGLAIDDVGEGSYAAVHANSPPGSPNRGSQAQSLQAPGLCSQGRRKTVLASALVGLAVCAAAGAIAAKRTQVKASRSQADKASLPQAAPPRNALDALGIHIPLPWDPTSTTTTTVTSTTTTKTTTTKTTTRKTTRTSTTTKKTTSTKTTTEATTTEIAEEASAPGEYPSLFCFSVMRADGYELSLLRSQLNKGVSIFQCEDWAVYSDTKTWLTPGPPVRLETTVINASLEAPTGQIEHILNTDIFIQAFNMVHKHPRFEQNDWFVKIDPDAVFFPSRLKTHLLKAAPEPGANLYFWNCPASFKFFGAVEVFSKEAMKRYFKGLGKCKSELDWKEWGEDMFLRRCMDLVGVEHKEDFGLLMDAYCGEQPNPCNADKVAFHPFKAPETYFNCLEEATSETPEPTPAPTEAKAEHSNKSSNATAARKARTSSKSEKVTTTVKAKSQHAVHNKTSSSEVASGKYPSLFCFSVMRADGYELSLLRSQLNKGASIFQCEDWAVYSDTKTWLTPGPPVRLETTVINTTLEAPEGQIEHILNTDIFIQAFNMVHEHPRYEHNDWFVKIDPDAVFFPSRLKTHLLKAAPQPGANIYFWNCPASFKFFGAVEVFSKVAMDTYFDGLDRCKTEFPWTTWGEDMFLRRCMDLLGVEHREDFRLLMDAYCGEQPYPCNSEKVAFHPFKASETYFKCLEEATAGETESESDDEPSGVAVTSV